ncbi:hypothetical protein KFE25_002891 [Diacronema lutheri]|uniref:JmjC domain-containing protein n=1 Tax=Diacronema lutheri TaxID=2081491 RepID=A0A8J5XLU1_DIALT|nr:hypothetical protein KFE25_002891 [Diacronema lutheri]
MAALRPTPTARIVDSEFEGSAAVIKVQRLALECYADEPRSPVRAAALVCAARALRDQAHAALHTGPWRDASLAWREAYMFGALHLAQGGRPAADRDAALQLVRTLDLGLMLGASAYRSELLALIGSLEATELRECGGDGSSATVAVDDGPWLPAPLELGAPGAICPSGHPLRVMARPSLERFLLHCMAPAQPALLTGVLDGWPALGARSWRNLGYLKRVAGHRTVPVELGEDYLHPDWSEDLMTFGAFVDRHLAHATPPSALAEEAAPEPVGRVVVASATADAAGVAPPAAATDGAHERARKRKRAPVGYLAQHALLEQVPALAADICVPDYCALSIEPDADDGADGDGGDATRSESTRNGRAAARSPARVNVWLGPGGTVSPLHHDPEHNLLAQVAGAKYVRLYAPGESARLYAHPTGVHKVSSQIRDVHNVDSARFPLFAGARYIDGWLRAGEALYIPPRWWHHVESLQPSCSVSFWWT